jgi:hypothetical protein
MALNSPPSRRRNRLIRWMPLLALLVCSALVVGMAWFKQTSSRVLGGPFQPPEMAAVQFATRNMVGDLGGVPVTIPRHFANYVEYEGDPGFGEKRIGPRPERTYASKLTSFGFYVRFPDMAGMSSYALETDKRTQTIYKTMWIGVGINTGERYPGDGFLDRQASSINDPSRFFQYEAQPQKEDELTVYAPTGVDPRTQRPMREDDDAEDIFLHRDQNGRVDAYISCSNRPHQAAPCSHDFSMEPYMKAHVYVSYRRGLLPQWQQIQSSVAQLIKNFKAPEAAADANKR